MKSDKSKDVVEEMLLLAGIKVSGENPWDIKVHNTNFYGRFLAGGTLALGESYVDRWWDCKKLDEFFYRVFRCQINKKVKNNFELLMRTFAARLFNFQKKHRTFRSVGRHYDIGNELYKNMLDERMTYTCAYWKNAKDLDSAQEAKLDLVCKKMGLKPGTNILDIGCGWGSFAKYAAEKYRVNVVGITVSKEQIKLGRQLCKGLPVKIEFQDYRDLNEKFDGIVSLGMFEHVGYKNYKTYMAVAHHCLKEEGLFLLHTIGSNTSEHSIDPWINKYIFPDAMVPSAKQIASSVEGLFVLEDWHSFGEDYDKTLMAWYANFVKSWNEIKKDYDERFYRMWTYHLLCCAGTFRARENQLWQIVFSKKGVLGGYQCVR